MIGPQPLGCQRVTVSQRLKIHRFRYGIYRYLHGKLRIKRRFSVFVEDRLYSRGSYTGHRDDLAPAIDRVWEDGAAAQRRGGALRRELAASRTAPTVLRGRMTSSSPSASPLAFATVITPRGALSLEQQGKRLFRWRTPSPHGSRRRSRAERAMGSCNSASPRPGRGCPRIFAFWRGLAMGFVAARCRAGKTRPPSRVARNSPVSPTKRRRCGAGNISTPQRWRRCGGSSTRPLRTNSPRAVRASTPFSPRATAAGGMWAVCISISPKTARMPSVRSPFSPPMRQGSPPTARSATPLSARRCASTPAREPRPSFSRLLEPVSRAGERCAWLKAIVDSGEIFDPLRWTPSEAMRLLEDVATLEQAGLVVRMPAGWPTPPEPAQGRGDRRHQGAVDGRG